ncbi:unnamed protein product [Linum trigynum]|uniref:Secreted protein n=1 Tax=Linum trigynum TaxID=586398 RepID=A0AAV2EU23_9ROSI
MRIYRRHLAGALSLELLVSPAVPLCAMYIDPAKNRNFVRRGGVPKGVVHQRQLMRIVSLCYRRRRVEEAAKGREGSLWRSWIRSWMMTLWVGTAVGVAGEDRPFTPPGVWSFDFVLGGAHRSLRMM